MNAVFIICRLSRTCSRPCNCTLQCICMWSSYISATYDLRPKRWQSWGRMIFGPASHANHAVYDICKLQTADRRLQTTDRRLQTADCRSQIADCKLNDSKNLPNKGDIIKNVTSCESEKVAWLIFLRNVTLDSFPRCCWLFFFDPFSTHPAYH